MGVGQTTEGGAVTSRLSLLRWGDFLRVLAILAVLALTRPDPAGAQREPVNLPPAMEAAGPPARPEDDVLPVPELEPDRPTTVAPGPEPSAFPVQVVPKAVARCEGIAAPGLQVVLTSEGSTGAGAQVRWVQTQGPPVTLDDPMVRAARLTIPEGATGTLGFLLVVGNALGVDTAALTIPIEARARGPKDPTLRADAGDDQVGLVGRMVTLNAIRSEPRGKIGYRWLQVGGPAVKLKIEDGYTFSFIPPGPGIYRFALVVAAGSEISEPARVNVTVATAQPATSPTIASDAAAGAPPGVAAVEPLDELARAALAAIEGGAEAAGPLAEAFDGIADRMDLYRAFSDAQSEMSRRLEEIVPQDPGRRGVWIERLFTPLTARLVGAMLAEGLDLRVPAGQSASLTAGQRARLADLYRSMAEGFRATSPPR
jgi:hypothetical protein